MMVKISAAISCLYRGLEKEEQQYIEALNVGSEFDLATRSLLLVYFGDVHGDTYTYIDDCQVDWSRTRKEIFSRLSSDSVRNISLRYWDITMLSNFFISRPHTREVSLEEKSILINCTYKHLSFSEHKNLYVEQAYLDLLRRGNLEDS